MVAHFGTRLFWSPASSVIMGKELVSMLLMQDYLEHY